MQDWPDRYHFYHGSLKGLVLVHFGFTSAPSIDHAGGSDRNPSVSKGVVRGGLASRTKLEAGSDGDRAIAAKASRRIQSQSHWHPRSTAMSYRHEIHTPVLKMSRGYDSFSFEANATGPKNSLRAGPTNLYPRYTAPFAMTTGPNEPIGTV